MALLRSEETEKKNKTKNWGYKVLGRLCSHDLNDQ